ncbi:MAG TPA: hypothetical protein VKB65_01540 [Myxococcota bacterium]|nr:hypothetical protein [Myxococcota bacterium]
MKTIATMALLLGTIAVGIAPAAEAHDARDAGKATQREWNARTDHRQRDFRSPARGQLHARQVIEIRRLAGALERTTDELGRDARRAAGRVNRFEARAVWAVYRLEEAADRFERETGRRGPLEVRELRQELRRVNVAFSDARQGAHALRRSPELHRDFARVGDLLEQLDEAFEPGRRVAWNDGRFPFGRR